MRVIAGTHRGRLLHGPHGSALRPTSDRVREALGSILAPRLPHSRFLDLYAGTGAVAIEARSRGAQQVTCVESNETALALLHRNLAACDMTGSVTVHAESVAQFLRGTAEQRQGLYDIVFADPPYTDTQELVALLARVPPPALFATEAWLIIEHAAKGVLPPQVGVCVLRRTYAYGDTALSVFDARNEGAA